MTASNRPVLIVVDMLNDFFRAGPLAANRDALVHRVNELVGFFRDRDLPIIWVRQEFATDLSDAFPAMREKGKSITIAGTEGAQILSGLDRRPGDIEVVKKRFSPFFQTNLDEVLGSLRVDTIVVAGVNTHACVRMTAIDAYQRDYRVAISSDAVASYDQEHHDVTLAYLANEIATVSTNEELMQSWDW